MSQYYKTTDPQSTDFMDELPLDYMGQAIHNTEAYNDQQIAQTDLLANAAAKINYLPSDAQRVSEKQEEYNQRINDLVDKINKSPQDYTKHMPALRSLSRDMTDDMSNGELGNIMSNANSFQQWDTEAHKQVVDGKITPEAYQIARVKMLNDFSKSGGTAYNQATKVGNKVSTESLVPTVNLNKMIKDATENIKANSSDWARDNITGEWIFTNKNKNEQVEAGRVANVALNTVLGDPEAMSYLRQGSRLGYLNGVYDQNGQFIQPYNVDKKGNIRFNNQSMLSAPIQAAVGRSAYRKVESEQGTKANPYGEKGYQYGLDLKKFQFEEAQKTGDAQKAADLKLGRDEELALWKAALAQGISVDALKAKLSGNGASLTESPDGVTTVTPFAGLDKNPDGSPKPITPEAINGVLLPTIQDRMADNLAQIKNPDLTPNQRALFQQQYDENKAQYDKLTDISGKAHQWAVENLPKSYNHDDLSKYYDYTAPNSPVKAKLTSSLNAAYSQLQALRNPAFDNYLNTNPANAKKGGVPSSIPPYTDPAKAKNILDQIDGIQKVMGKYDKMDEQIKGNETQWFKDNSDQTKFKLNGAGLTVPNKTIIYNAIKANPDAVQVTDLNMDNSDAAKTLQDQIKHVLSSGGNLSDYLDLKQINPPVAGQGVTISATVKPNSGFWHTAAKVATLGIHNDKDFYAKDGEPRTILLTLPNNTLHTIGANLSKGSQSEQAVAKTINEHDYASTLSALTNQILDAKGTNNEQPFATTTMFNPETGAVHAIRMTPMMNPNPNNRGDVMSYKLEFDDGHGNYRPFIYDPVDNKGNKILRQPMSEFPNAAAAVQALYGRWVPGQQQ